MSESTVQLVTGSKRESYTRAAREYVHLVRLRLEGELARHGPQVTEWRSYQRLAGTITPEALRAAWPDADIDEVLR